MMAKIKVEVLDSFSKVSDTSKVFEKINTSTRDVSDQVRDVSAATEEISASVEEITATLTEISRGFEENVLTLKNVAQASNGQLDQVRTIYGLTESLEEKSKELESSIQKYEI